MAAQYKLQTVTSSKEHQDLSSAEASAHAVTINV